MSAAITVNNLSKKYGTLEALKGISFEVQSGEIFGFLGPNEAGKTTTVNILTGILRPNDGSATILGHDVTKDSYQAKERIGVVHEVSNVYPEYSAYNNLMFSAVLYSVPRKIARERVDYLLDIFFLRDKKYAKARKISQGMKRKLAIAMALIHQPQVLFLDEPTTGVDIATVFTIREIIKELNSRGVTIFLTTHNINEASIICHRVAIINKGEIIAIDTPENLRKAAKRVQSVEVEFDVPPAKEAEILEYLPSASKASKRGDKLILTTDDPHRLMEEILEYSRKTGCVITHFNTPGPSFEDVFIELTGIKPKSLSAMDVSRDG